MNINEILSKVDHTLLAQDATANDIKTLCDDAIQYKTASVCIPPSFISFAHQYCAGRMAVCTVVGFPNGYNTTAAKVFETEDAVRNGADEIDMVINIGALKNADYDYVKNEIFEVRNACRGKILKVIIETCLLTDDEKRIMCGIVTESGADFIKTSTGFAGGGATAEDIRLMAENVGRGVRVKAAGGISTLRDAELFITLGAARLGTSRIIKLVKNQGDANGY